MRTAGVRELKNRISAYLRMVAEGETVLVTDRGRVVAQILPPPVYHGLPHASEQAALERLARTGRVRMGAGVPPSAQAIALPVPSERLDAAALLAEVRSDRP